jgi:hypothetical protein
MNFNIDSNWYSVWSMYTRFAYGDIIKIFCVFGVVLPIIVTYVDNQLKQRETIVANTKDSKEREKLRNKK